MKRQLTEPGLLIALHFNGQSEIGQFDGRSFGFAGQQQVFRLKRQQSGHVKKDEANGGRQLSLRLRLPS